MLSAEIQKHSQDFFDRLAQEGKTTHSEGARRAARNQRQDHLRALSASSSDASAWQIRSSRTKYFRSLASKI